MACCGNISQRAVIFPRTAPTTSTGSPPNSTTGPANGSDSANRSRRSPTCFWLHEDHPAQPLAPDHTSASFLIAASPDAAPEESKWSPRSRAAARRNDLDADQRQPSIRRRGRMRPHPRNPASAAQETLHTPASTTVALSQEAVCVATTDRIRPTLSGTGRSGSGDVQVRTVLPDVNAKATAARPAHGPRSSCLRLQAVRGPSAVEFVAWARYRH